MSIRTSPWPAGVPCWADLTTPDLVAAEVFYGAVLDWSFADADGTYGGYVIGEARGAAAGGIGPQQEGSPVAWTMYLASDDVDATATAITDRGGRVLTGPGEVGPMGRMLVATDPTGAAFGVWQARTHIGAGLVNEPGGLTWEDLRSPDPAVAQAFYAAVFGYRTEAMAEAGEGYATFSRSDEDAPLGGMGPMAGNEGSPPHWLLYFGVADADAATQAAESNGGSMVVPTFDSPYGRMAGLTDPAGARFWVVQTDGSGQPDRSG